jgi:hypothetical protein
LGCAEAACHVIHCDRFQTKVPLFSITIVALLATDSHQSKTTIRAFVVADSIPRDGFFP